MRFARWGGARTLPLGVHSGGFRPPRQHPFGEVQALLHVAHLLPQSPHVSVERGELLGRVERSLELAVAGTAPQALGPQPEHQRERRVNRGMPGLARADREPDSDQVDGAQRDGDRKPDRRFEGHGTSRHTPRGPRAQCFSGGRGPDTGPVDTHMDHQVASILTIRAWTGGEVRTSRLYFFEVNSGSQTEGFLPYISPATTTSATCRACRPTTPRPDAIPPTGESPGRVTESAAGAES